MLCNALPAGTSRDSALASLTSITAGTSMLHNDRRYAWNLEMDCEATQQLLHKRLTYMICTHFRTLQYMLQPLPYHFSPYNIQEGFYATSRHVLCHVMTLIA